MLERGGGLEGEVAIGARMCNDQKRESIELLRFHVHPTCTEVFPEDPRDSDPVQYSPAKQIKCVLILRKTQILLTE
jgi:hypothetical protein